VVIRITIIVVIAEAGSNRPDAIPVAQPTVSNHWRVDRVERIFKKNFPIQNNSNKRTFVIKTIPVTVLAQCKDTFWNQTNRKVFQYIMDQLMNTANDDDSSLLPVAVADAKPRVSQHWRTEFVSELILTKANYFELFRNFLLQQSPKSLQLGGRSRIFWGRWMFVVRSKTLPSSCTLCSMRQHCLISTAGSSEGFLTWHLITPAQIIACTRCGKKVTPDIICCFLGKYLEWVSEWVIDWVSDWLSEWVSEWVSTV